MITTLRLADRGTEKPGRNNASGKSARRVDLIYRSRESFLDIEVDSVGLRLPMDERPLRIARPGRVIPGQADVDGVLKESDRAVAEPEIGPAGVHAAEGLACGVELILR